MQNRQQLSAILKAELASLVIRPPSSENLQTQSWAATDASIPDVIHFVAQEQQAMRFPCRHIHECAMPAMPENDLYKTT